MRRSGAIEYACRSIVVVAIYFLGLEVFVSGSIRLNLPGSKDSKVLVGSMASMITSITLGAVIPINTITVGMAIFYLITYVCRAGPGFKATNRLYSKKFIPTPGSELTKT
jgi:hypothetical protein